MKSGFFVFRRMLDLANVLDSLFTVLMSDRFLSISLSGKLISEFFMCLLSLVARCGLKPLNLPIVYLLRAHVF